MNEPSLMGYPSLSQQQQQLPNGTPNTLHQQLHGLSNNPMPPPGLMNSNDLPNNLGNGPRGINANNNNNNNPMLSASHQLLDQLTNGNANMGMNNNTSPNANNTSMSSNAPSQSLAIASINANANNPLFHPHLEDPTLLSNPIWKLQLQLANVSLQSLGQPNVYARQNAMKKYLASQNQSQNTSNNTLTAPVVPNNTNNPTIQPQSQTTTGAPTTNENINQSQQQQQTQPSEMSMSLVDRTKKLLMEMATETSKEKGKTSKPSTANSANNGNSMPNNTNEAMTPSSANTPLATTNNSRMGTPTTPHTELLNTRDQNSTTPSVLLQHKKLSQQYNIDEDDEIENRMVAPKDTKYNDQLWHAIDFSNLQIFHINDNLFKYTFLTRLRCV